MKYSEAEEKFLEWLKDQPIPVDEEAFKVSSEILIYTAREIFHDDSDDFLLKIVRQEEYLCLVPLRPFDKDEVASELLACIAIVRNSNLPWSERLNSIIDILSNVLFEFAFAVVRKDHATNNDEMDILRKGEIPEAILAEIASTAISSITRELPNVQKMNVSFSDLSHLKDCFLCLILPSVEREGSIYDIEYKAQHAQENIISYPVLFPYVCYLIAISFKALFLCSVLQELKNVDIGFTTFLKKMKKNGVINMLTSFVLENPFDYFVKAHHIAKDSCKELYSIELGLCLAELAALVTADEVPFIAFQAHRNVAREYRYVTAEKNKNVKQKILEYAKHKIKRAKLSGKKISYYTLAKEIYEDLNFAKREQENNKLQKDLSKSTLQSLPIDLDLSKIPTSDKTIYNWLREADILPNKKRRPI